MLASSKALLTFLCFACTYFLYTHNHFSTSPDDYAIAPTATSDAVIFDSRPSTSQIALLSNNPSAHKDSVSKTTDSVSDGSEKKQPAEFVSKTANSVSDGSEKKQPADFVSKTANSTSDVSEEKRSKILQATMMFGDKYKGLNERTLQSHVDHAKRWGYGDHILRREIVGAGQWDKFIFSKLLHVQDLIMGELKKEREERAEWVVWYDADTLILNPNIQWELFLPPNTYPNIDFMATKNVDGFNAGLFFFRVNEWSVELLSDAYSLRRLRPEIEIQGNIEQNSMKHLFGEERNKKHIVYQPQHWYNGFKGNPRAETEINEGDMLVHFAGINHDNEEELKNELMSQWFAKIEQHPDKWQVPLEKTKYPKEIDAFWRMYKEAKDMLDTVHVRPDSQSGPDQDVKGARDELLWAIEELAYDAAHMKKCMDDMAQALNAAESPQVMAASSGHAHQQAFGSAKGHTEPADDEQDSSVDTQQQLATGFDVKTESPEVPRRFKSPPAV